MHGVSGEGPSILIRSYQADDYFAAHRLYRRGLLLGHLDPQDTAGDLYHIEEVYLQQPRSHFWVAEHRGQVIGTIAVAQDEQLIARIRRLRVDPRWPNSSVAGQLVQRAVEHCREYGYLKVVLDTHLHTDEALALLQQRGFLHTRSRPARGKFRLEFYTDLYHQPHEDTEDQAPR